MASYFLQLYLEENGLLDFPSLFCCHPTWPTIWSAHMYKLFGRRKEDDSRDKTDTRKQANKKVTKQHQKKNLTDWITIAEGEEHILENENYNQRRLTSQRSITICFLFLSIFQNKIINNVDFIQFHFVSYQKRRNMDHSEKFIICSRDTLLLSHCFDVSRIMNCFWFRKIIVFKGVSQNFMWIMDVVIRISYAKYDSKLLEVMFRSTYIYLNTNLKEQLNLNIPRK